MANDIDIKTGEPTRLGATWDGDGTNFAVFSSSAESIELCLFDPDGRNERRIELPELTNEVFHGYLPGIGPGQLYGLRAHGRYEPENGLRFNPNKLLIDPYARAITDDFVWGDEHSGFTIDADNPDMDLTFDTRDNAATMAKCRVIDPNFYWNSERRPRVPWDQTIVYEVNVRGFTRTHPAVPERQRGTFAGMTAPQVVDYIKALGVTSVELLPVHAFFDERATMERGLCNFWGYNSIAFHAPAPRFAVGDDVTDFKTMVKVFHDAGIEVILDVVYNHTAEGNHCGPTLSFRGLDNNAYYHLMPGDKRHYLDFTGCGNSLNLNHPRTLQLVTSSLRYWVEEMHVDGFRFDLATTLARDATGTYDIDSNFLVAVGQDPVLAGAKLIAEPWDVGMGGYQVGGFPPGWAEWNDEYRDIVREFWKGNEGMVPKLASKMAGSAETFNHRGRRPWASVNFVTAHDGFTLRDVVSFNDKHNEANNEDNRDGSNNNHSWNCGAEGQTDDSEINALRERQIRNFLVTLFTSQGTPMLLGGDEFGRSQGGNNNAYCQDSEIGWLDWELAEGAGKPLVEFTKFLIALRRAHPALRRAEFPIGEMESETRVKDIMWLRPDGEEKGFDDWGATYARALAFAVGASETSNTGAGDEARFLILFNAHHEMVPFTLPELDAESGWLCLIDTFRGKLEPHQRKEFRSPYELGPRASAVFARAPQLGPLA